MEMRRTSIPNWKRQQVYEEFGGRCMYCGEELTDGYAIEHLHPVCRGGGNNIDNLGLSCPRCNAQKGMKTIEEFRESLILDAIRKKNKGFFSQYTKGLGRFVTEEQESTITDFLVEMDFYLSRDLDLKFYFEKEFPDEDNNG